MDADEAKIDKMVLALLYLTTFHHSHEMRSGKSHDWAARERLHHAGYISDPHSKAKSVLLSDEGARKSKALLERQFLRQPL